MANSKDSSIEYTILTLDHESKSWQPQGMTNEMDKALASAEKLLATGNYDKIEIKQKYFDKKANRLVEGSLKTLEYTAPSGILPIIGLLVLAVFLGGGSFAAAYFLTKQDAPVEETAESGDHGATEKAAEKKAPEDKAAHH